ncbi:methylated-DNA--[protein]-cysteine S-methyltransferase [uncultured Pontibacter sp.]|uniref:methylated-DNA--[protein]-cysteine S-methyltransferase n=1 Tax=uncultured Pontibacter sp. TaxID=453356 RepID=UPI0026147028|nr:methylated-DNA--[protein]-cysteine S-methyltransferase [uncultured Pontibacter sp.]
MNHYQTVAAALAYIRANALRQPNLEELAGHACMSPFHFQRVFTEWAGVSPKKFLQYLTLQHAKAVMAKTVSLAEAAECSCLSSTSRLHDLFLSIEGITPGTFKQLGQQLQLKYSINSCPFGNYIVASTPKGICHLHFFRDQAAALVELRQTWPKAELVNALDAQHEQVQVFFQRTQQQPAAKIRLHLQGTPFQLKVWEALLRIPEGCLTSYASLAQQIGQPTASRAVGTAIGSNPIAFLIPCHRVIKSIGGIGEYRWGSERKMAMIGWEAARNQVQIEPQPEQLSMF